MTMMNPRQMSMMPKLRSSIRQQIPLVSGQNGLGADIVSTTAPPLRDTLLLTETASDRGYEARLKLKLNIQDF